MVHFRASSAKLVAQIELCSAEPPTWLDIGDRFLSVNGLRTGIVVQPPAGSPPKLLAHFDDGSTYKVLLEKVRKIAFDKDGASGDVAPTPATH